MPSARRPAHPAAAEVLAGGTERRARTALEVSPDRVSIGGTTRRVHATGGPDALYQAYLAVLYAVRRAAPGQELTLRADDLDVLLGAVGGDVETIELRLVELMGCTQQEASALRRVLLRHRAVLTAAGVAAAVTATAVVPAALSGGGSATAAPGPARSVVVGLADGGDPTSARAVDPLPARVPADAAPVAAGPAPVAPVVAAPAREPDPAAVPPAVAVPSVEPVAGEPAPPAVEVSIPALLGPPQLLLDPGTAAAPPAVLQDPRRGDWRSGLAAWRGADGAPRPQDAEGDGELPDDAHLVRPGGAPATAGPSTRTPAEASDGPAADANGRRDPGGA